MAGSQPDENYNGAMGSILTVAGKFKPLSDRAISLVSGYDIKGIMAVVNKVTHCSLEVLMDVFNKVLMDVSFGFQALVYPI